MKVDLILRQGWVYRTYRQCFEKMDIAISGEKFYDISPVVHYEADTEVDCTGSYIIPGLIDIHMHVESSMTYPREFSKTVLPYGVTCVVADPHEIANVFGLEGILSFMEQETELDMFYGIPSCVPATNPRMETSGGRILEEDVLKLLSDRRVICLGEVMNFKELTAEEDTLIKKIVRLCKEHERSIRIEGHCPSLSGEDCSKFIFEGVDADHTQQTPESILEKTDKGMFLELQAKSLTPEVVKTVMEHQLYENIALVTDDTMPDHLVHKGQLNRIIKMAVDAGMPVEKAIYCATLTPARRMHLDNRGMIAPGKLADFAVLNDLSSFMPEKVFKNGKIYSTPSPSADQREGDFPTPSADQREGDFPSNEAGSKDNIRTNFPEHFYRSVRCNLAVENDFILQEFEKNVSYVTVNAMQIQSFGTAAKLVKREVEVKDGILLWQKAGLCLGTVFERYTGENGKSYGLVECAFKEQGAVATTWSHDSHNLLVLGNSIEDMMLSQHEIVKMQGGYCVVSKGKVLAKTKLSVGGIISDEPIEKLAEDLSLVRDAIQSLGYLNNNVIMSISTLTLLVSPEIKLSDKGLFLVKTQERIPLIESAGKETDIEDAD